MLRDWLKKTLAAIAALQPPPPQPALPAGVLPIPVGGRAYVLLSFTRCPLPGCPVCVKLKRMAERN